MRRVTSENDERSRHLVYCNECNKTFCELCLRKIKGLHHCDDREILKLCRRYKNASAEIKEKCHERWHWLKDYADARESELFTNLWVEEHASRCPNCKVPIERSDGCFHMHCTQCGTHYCYDCGEELVGSSYYDGTHRCKD